MPHTLQVRGNSMLPTFVDGQVVEFVEIDKGYELQRFDVVLFKLPGKDWQIKRVVGLPGEKIGFVGGKILVNGQMLDESKYLPGSTQTYKYKLANTKEKVRVEKEQASPTLFEENILESNCYYLLGDNRVNSTDSRDFGSVKLIDIAYLVAGKVG